jgi:hypothetical protein
MTMAGSQALPRGGAESDFSAHEINIIEIFKLERIKAFIYVIFIISIIPLRSDNVELNAMNTKEIQLPSNYKDYVNVFSKEEASKFLNSTRVKYFISIKEGVEVPYNPIYQLREHELGVLRDYLESN